jgi:hypothetical protein
VLASPSATRGWCTWPADVCGSKWMRRRTADWDHSPPDTDPAGSRRGPGRQGCWGVLRGRNRLREDRPTSPSPTTPPYRAGLAASGGHARSVNQSSITGRHGERNGSRRVCTTPLAITRTRNEPDPGGRSKSSARSYRTPYDPGNLDAT